MARTYEHFRFSYQTIAQRTFLVAESNSGEEPIPFLTGMLGNNRIVGALPMHAQRLNNTTNLYYNITGLTRFTDYVAYEPINRERGRSLLRNLVEALSGLPRYFFNANFGLLDTRYLFVDEKLQIHLALLPYESLDGDRSTKPLREFLTEWLGAYFATEKQDDYYDGLVKYLIKPDFELAEFRERVVAQQRPAVGSLPGDRPGLPPKPEQEPPPKVPGNGTGKASSSGAGKKAAKGPPSSGELKIPGMGKPGHEVKSSHSEPSEKKPEARERKGEKERISLFGKKLNFGAFGKPKAGEAENEREKKLSPFQVESHLVSEAEIAANGGNRSWQGTIGLEDDNRTVLLDGQAEQRRGTPFLLHRDRKIALAQFPFTIGRSSGSCVIDSNVVSKRHATITSQDGNYFIEDANAKNHTFVNGAMIPPFTPHKLADGDEIKLGDEWLEFRCE